MAAGVAGGDASRAVPHVTPLAAVDALTAQSLVARVAGRSVVGIDVAATIVARRSVPFSEFHKSLAPGIGLQHAPDDQKEVGQSAFVQRGADHPPPFAFAQRFIADMRVRDAVVGRGRLRIERDDPVGR